MKRQPAAPGTDLPPGWPEEWRGVLSDSALCTAGSGSIYDRALDYANTSSIEVSEEDPLPEPALRAFVRGSELYQTEIWIEDDQIAGSCSCPHAEEGWFCKHQTALALLWRQRLAAPPSAAAAATQANRPGTGRKRPLSLAGVLHAQDASTLADKLLELAGRDAEWARELHRWKKLQEAPADLDTLWEVITDTLEPDAEFLGWGETAEYVRRASGALPFIAQARKADPEGAVELCMDALRQGWSVLQRADDSDGDISGLCAELGAAFVATLEAAGPLPATFGDSYLALLEEDPFGSFDTEQAECALGPAAQARLRERLAQRWQTLVPPGTEGRPPRDFDARRWITKRHYLRQLERDGDLHEALVVLRSDLTVSAEHAELIAYLIDHGQPEVALRQAESSLLAHPRDRQIESEKLRALEHTGQFAEALVLTRSRFDRSPGLPDYQAVLKAATAAKADLPALRAELHASLVHREHEDLDIARRRHARMKPLGFSPYAALESPPPSAPNVSLRVEILLSEACRDEAWAAVQPPALCRGPLLHTLARHLRADRPADAVTLLQRVLRDEMRNAKSPYAEALALVREAIALMPPEPRGRWLADLRAEFKAKRNFIAGLPAG